ncbi:MAG TPA: CoA transferase [Mycobacteriales bacterium]|nr:CoA transferase [Mycobacteriales bacterium]
MSALAGARVVDLTQVMAGPFCTMLLADAGADVIKVELPGVGDQTRRSWGYPEGDADSPSFFGLNRNKRSICLDLRSDDGKAEFLDLVRTADIVVENFRPGVVRKLGVDYESVRQVNPGIIYASISGFGQTGPYSQRPGYDLIAQGMAGAISITGSPGGEPAKCGIPVGDLGAGLLCVYGILSAYIHRLKTGVGQYLETSLYEAVLAMSVWESVEYWATGVPPQPLGSANRMSAPYQALRTDDGYLTVGANNQRLWERLCRALGRDELIDDPRFAENMDRMEHRDELAGVLEEALAGRGTQEWVDILLDAGVPAGPILNYQQVLDDDPHVRARQMVQETEHPVAGRLKLLGFPVKMSETPAQLHRPPPLLGQHIEEIRNELSHG